MAAKYIEGNLWCTFLDNCNTEIFLIVYNKSVLILQSNINRSTKIGRNKMTSRVFASCCSIFYFCRHSNVCTVRLLQRRTKKFLQSYRSTIVDLPFENELRNAKNELYPSFSSYFGKLQWIDHINCEKYSGTPVGTSQSKHKFILDICFLNFTKYGKCTELEDLGNQEKRQSNVKETSPMYD